MARPIKETPILTGEDARRFRNRMKNPPKETPEAMNRIREAYRVGMAIMSKQEIAQYDV
jgi:hypothetical protein